MRIVIDATAAVSGGKVYLDQLLMQFALLRCDHEFIIFHAEDFGPSRFKDRLSDRFEFRRVALPSSKSRLWVGSTALKIFWRLVVLPLHLRRLKPDLFFSNAGFGPGWKMARTPTVLALHNSMPLRRELIAEETSALRRWRLILLRRFMRRALSASDGSIVFSENTKRLVETCFTDLGVEPSVVHHGIDWGAPERELSANNDGLDRFGIPSPYLLYVSQFHRYKNVLSLLNAFAITRDKHPQLSLTLVGDVADKIYWREVEAEIDRLGIGSRVIHIPACSRDRLQKIYARALAFVHPSLAETCSFPLLEAMAMGVPVAAARMSALPEMARDAAIYFDPYNPGEMADALDRLVRDKALRDDLSHKAVERARQFSWEEAARKTLKVFERVVTRHDSQGKVFSHE
jgi:glycosyltransferase involved in cell wall biosynthesis